MRPSLGIALWPADGATFEVLLRNADAARERAKQQATDYAFFNEGADVSASAPVDSSSRHPNHFGDFDA